MCGFRPASTTGARAPYDTRVCEIPYAKHHRGAKIREAPRVLDGPRGSRGDDDRERHADALPSHVSDKSAFTRLTITVYEICCKNKRGPRCRRKRRIAHESPWIHCLLLRERRQIPQRESRDMTVGYIGQQTFV